ncbi:MAG TPA: biotin carboxylase N-terminal domain-containing protein [Jatrophihabitantaceae bacterium]|nr:biotin carboxylase N-terminal domain-containing protein [Jatrophihabitantaceae bacterium]
MNASTGDTRPISSVLVANRGEIARRVFRTCRDQGIATVAVFSDADAQSPHTVEADAAVRLPGSTPAQTYLRAEAVIDAARRAGADAVHPGYGFLSENAGFARAVIAAGLTWIGPPPDAIAAMGSKIESKGLMAAAGVPVLDELRPDAVTDADLPVLIKASAGGGGRGMRIVTDLAELTREVEAASAEAASAFGDPTVFCEPYLATGRHIEVQIMADMHGTVWAVGERECSIQRRHQKVIEEAPSPLVERVDGMRERLFDAARSAAKAIGYAGAGTVEFLADEQGEFFFLEMNTRLQVEHPVTECTTGLDLVALQLLVAGGGALEPEPPPVHGHAIEVRLYAEDPAADWQPQSGVVHRLRVPGADIEFAVGTADSGIRLDSGVVDGTVVGIHYDPMLAKVIGWAPTREHAITLLSGALQRTALHGLVTNRDLLVNVLRHQAFRRGDTTTAFFTDHGLPELAAPLVGEQAERLAAVAAAVAADAGARAAAPVLGEIPSTWRNVFSQPQHTLFTGPSGPHDVVHRGTRNGLQILDDAVAVVSSTPDEVVLDVDGVHRRFSVVRYGEDVYVDSPMGSVHLVAAPRFADPAASVAAGSLLAPMPGSVLRIGVAVGDIVSAGQPILWLEAMKMQHQINAPVDGRVAELLVREAEQVDVGAVLAVVTQNVSTQEEETS